MSPPPLGPSGEPADGVRGRPPADGVRGRPPVDGLRSRPPADGLRLSRRESEAARDRIESDLDGLPSSSPQPASSSSSQTPWFCTPRLERRLTSPSPSSRRDAALSAATTSAEHSHSSA